MQYLATMVIDFYNFRIELYYNAASPAKVTTDPYEATVRPLEELTDLIDADFGAKHSRTGPAWIFEKVLVIDSGVL